MRAAIFIDGGYLLKQLQDAKVNPDYSRLAEFLLKPLRRNTQLDLMRCYFYYCPPWMSEKPTEAELRRMAAHERFMAEIQEGCDRWQVRLGKLERRREGDKEVFAQKRVDVQLSVDLVQHTAAGHIQHAVLVAGDSDFIPAIVAAKESGTTLTLWCDRDRSVHRDLLKLADEVHYIRWKDFPSRPFAEHRGDSQRQDGRGDARPAVEARTDAAGSTAGREPPPESSPAEARPDQRAEGPADQTGAPMPGEPEVAAKKKRGRRRGGGKNAAAKVAVSDASDVSDARTGPVSAEDVLASGPVEPAAAAKPRGRAPSRPAIRSVMPEPLATPVPHEEVGDDIGNRADEEGTQVAKAGRRRRGGRGRRRKGAGAPPSSGEPS